MPMTVINNKLIQDLHPAGLNQRQIIAMLKGEMAEPYPEKSLKYSKNDPQHYALILCHIEEIQDPAQQGLDANLMLGGFISSADELICCLYDGNTAEIVEIDDRACVTLCSLPPQSFELVRVMNQTCQKLIPPHLKIHPSVCLTATHNLLLQPEMLENSEAHIIGLQASEHPESIRTYIDSVLYHTEKLFYKQTIEHLKKDNCLVNLVAKRLHLNIDADDLIKMLLGQIPPLLPEDPAQINILQPDCNSPQEIDMIVMLAISLSEEDGIVQRFPEIKNSHLMLLSDDDNNLFGWIASLSQEGDNKLEPKLIKLTTFSPQTRAFFDLIHQLIKLRHDEAKEEALGLLGMATLSILSSPSRSYAISFMDEAGLWNYAVEKLLRYERISGINNEEAENKQYLLRKLAQTGCLSRDRLLTTLLPLTSENVTSPDWLPEYLHLLSVPLAEHGPDRDALPDYLKNADLNLLLTPEGTVMAYIDDTHDQLLSRYDFFSPLQVADQWGEGVYAIFKQMQDMIAEKDFIEQVTHVDDLWELSETVMAELIGDLHHLKQAAANPAQRDRFIQAKLQQYCSEQPFN